MEGPITYICTQEQHQTARTMFIFILFVFLFILQAEALTTSPTSSTLFDDFCSSIDGHQDAIIGAICEHDTGAFSRDPWQSGKASGLTRVSARELLSYEMHPCLWSEQLLAIMDLV